MKTDLTISKPFIKWVGGKRQIVDKLISKLPNKFNKYYEPFVGAGALFFSLNLKKSYISDINEELINLYKVIRDKDDELILDLNKHKNTERYFYSIRNIDRNGKYSKWSDIQKASRFIYLNKTCFNGLYRVNSKGQFNAPFGFYKNPRILDQNNLKECSLKLKETEIICGSYLLVEKKAKRGDFIYFDPPYMPLSTTANFTGYTKGGFTNQDQVDLRNLCDRLTKKGVLLMQSNSYTNSILHLYKDYKIHITQAIRAINCKGDKRGRINEVIITNY